MKPTKARHNPDKKQNRYGGDWECIYCDGECCEAMLSWGVKDEHGILKCKGNRHNCVSLLLKYEVANKTNIK